MLVMHLTADEGRKDALLVILEPGNIAKLEAGQPIIKKLSDFLPGVNTDIVFAYTPDILFVTQKIREGCEVSEVLEESLTRPKIFTRNYHEAEDLSKAELKEKVDAEGRREG